MALVKFECCDTSYLAEPDEIQKCEFCGEIIEPKQGYTWYGENTDQELANLMMYGPGADVYDWDGVYAGWTY